jgi:hypothetical protein
MTRIVDYDAYSGITETYHKDPVTGKISVNKSKDLTANFDQNALERNSAKTGWKESFHKVASIDPIVIEMWYNELRAAGYQNPNPLAAENKMWLIAKLNSRDFQKLRTKDGII